MYAEGMAALRSGGGMGRKLTHHKVRRREWVRKRTRSSNQRETQAHQEQRSASDENSKNPRVIKQLLSQSLQRLNAGTSSLDGLCERVGTPRDGTALRNQIKERSYTLAQLLKVCDTHLANLKAAERAIAQDASKKRDASSQKDLTMLRAARATSLGTISSGQRHA